MNNAPPPENTKRAPRFSWYKLLPWLITVLCFTWLYWKIDAAAAAEGQRALPYLAGIFSEVNWPRWLALMIPYSVLYLVIDTLTLWSAINWFNAKVRYTALLPVRAAAYIISLLNEQIGKGAIALFMYRTRKIPGTAIASTMLFLMFCEFYYLLCWALVGYGMADPVLAENITVARVLSVLPLAALAAGAVFALVLCMFRMKAFEGLALRSNNLFSAFRRARLGYYAAIILMRSPAMFFAILVYAEAARLFGLDIPLRNMLTLLPIIFFGTLVPGPFRAAAIALWSVLAPEQDPGRIAAFGFAQHNFFVLFNAVIGLIFLPSALGKLFAKPGGEPNDAPS